VPSSKAVRAGRAALVATLAVLFGFVGEFAFAAFLGFDLLGHQCPSAASTPVFSLLGGGGSCGNSVSFLLLAPGFIAGACFGAVFGVGAIHVVRAMRRTRLHSWGGHPHFSG
jgi:hypothetical protein